MKICVFGNKKSTLFLLTNLLKNNYTDLTLITLNQKSKKNIEISGLEKNLDLFCNNNKVNLYKSKSYSLKKIIDNNHFKKNRYDIGFSAGWQRIIPLEILNTFKYGVYGWHGSGFKLPNGRGRSPINWSIRLGQKKIYHNFFKYDEEADSGGIFETKIIYIKSSDYISDIQDKALEHIKDSSIRLIKKAKLNSIKLQKQANYPSIIFPALNELSGQLYPCDLNANEALNIIRSCSKPFPGAYIVLNKRKIKIWKAEKKSFKIKYRDKFFPGKIILKKNKIYIHFKDGILESKDFQIK